MKKTLKLRIESVPSLVGKVHSHIEISLKTWYGKHVNTPMRGCVHANQSSHYVDIETTIDSCEMFAEMNNFKFKLERI